MGPYGPTLSVSHIGLCIGDDEKAAYVNWQRYTWLTASGGSRDGECVQLQFGLKAYTASLTGRIILADQRSRHSRTAKTERIVFRRVYLPPRRRLFSDLPIGTLTSRTVNYLRHMNDERPHSEGTYSDGSCIGQPLRFHPE